MPVLLRPLIAAMLAALCLASPASAQGDPRPAAFLSVGPDYGASGAQVWRQAVVTGEIRSARTVIWGLQPIYSFAVTRRGGLMAGAGLHTALRLGVAEVTPHFSVVLWQDGQGGFEARELLQFRSGIDLMVPLTQSVSVGVGIYHVSNAGITRRSADMDVVRLGLQWRY